jgi:hypothetical protein
MSAAWTAWPAPETPMFESVSFDALPSRRLQNAVVERRESATSVTG